MRFLDSAFVLWTFPFYSFYPCIRGFGFLRFFLVLGTWTFSEFSVLPRPSFYVFPCTRDFWIFTISPSIGYFECLRFSLYWSLWFLRLYLPVLDTLLFHVFPCYVDRVFTFFSLYWRLSFCFFPLCWRLWVFTISLYARDWIFTFSQYWWLYVF